MKKSWPNIISKSPFQFQQRPSENLLIFTQTSSFCSTEKKGQLKKQIFTRKSVSLTATLNLPLV